MFAFLIFYYAIAFNWYNVFSPFTYLNNVQGMSKLKTLDLSWNDLTNTRDDLSILRKHSPSLTCLDLRHNNWQKVNNASKKEILLYDSRAHLHIFFQFETDFRTYYGRREQTTDPIYHIFKMTISWPFGNTMRNTIKRVQVMYWFIHLWKRHCNFRSLKK